MESYKLRVKIGVHEFEAEGPEDIVRQQFDEFKSLVESVRASKPQLGGAAPSETPAARAAPGLEVQTEQISRLFHHDEKRNLVTLTALPPGDNRDANAVLLALLGYRLLRGEDVVPISRLMTSLKKSGCDLVRIDRAASDYIPALIMKGGRARGGKYQLTNQGYAEARRLMEELLAHMG